MLDLPVIQPHASCVTLVPLFRRLSPDLQRMVGSLATPTRLARGELLHAAGDDVGHLFVVHRGRVKLVRSTAEGTQRVLRVAETGDVVGEHALLTGERPGYFVEALEDASLCTFSHADLAELLGRYPTVAIELLRILSSRLDEAEQALTRAAVDVPVRLANHLLDLPTLRGEDGLAVQWSMSKKDTASYLGTTPESLSRALSKLQRHGLVRSERGTTYLVDIDGLERLASG